MFVKHLKYCNALKSAQPCLPLAELEGKVSAARLTDEVFIKLRQRRILVEAGNRLGHSPWRAAIRIKIKQDAAACARPKLPPVLVGNLSCPFRLLRFLPQFSVGLTQ